MLFVGRGCSRSYKVSQYPGLKDDIFFLDDRSFYDDEMMFNGVNERVPLQRHRQVVVGRAASPCRPLLPGAGSFIQLSSGLASPLIQRQVCGYEIYDV
jgi:hypothetical protein